MGVSLVTTVLKILNQSQKMPLKVSPLWSRKRKVTISRECSRKSKKKSQRRKKKFPKSKSRQIMWILHLKEIHIVHLVTLTSRLSQLCCWLVRPVSLVMTKAHFKDPVNQIGSLPLMLMLVLLIHRKRASSSIKRKILILKNWHLHSAVTKVFQSHPYRAHSKLRKMSKSRWIYSLHVKWWEGLKPPKLYQAMTFQIKKPFRTCNWNSRFKRSQIKN
jgi:hypothetical protein